MNNSPLWEKLPAVAIANIYKYLDKEDLYSASQTCWHWRGVLFQKSFFQNFKFTLNVYDDRQCNFFLHNLLYLTNELTIVFDFLKVYHINKVRRILLKLIRTENLHGIRFRTNSVGLVLPGDKSEDDVVDIEGSFVDPLMLLLSRKKPSIKVVDLGAIESLTYYGTEFLKALKRPQELQEVTFASIKYDSSHYPILTLEHDLFEKCVSLQVLSLDYDTLNEDILRTIQILPLKTFLICVHGLDMRQPGISEAAWTEFSTKFKDIKLVLTLAYAYEAVEALPLHLLRRNMPLTHLRVVFCKFINLEALEMVSSYYQETLKSVYWVDSAFDEHTRNPMDLFLHSGTDPFVMMAWRCRQLQEIVVHGYVLDMHNLLGIARVKSELKKLEVSMVEDAPDRMMHSVMSEIGTLLAQNWAPVDDPASIHPALGYTPVSDDVRDEYIFNIIRSDLSN